MTKIIVLLAIVTCLARSEAEPAENDLIKARQESELLHRSLNGKELPEQPVGAAVAEEASRSPGPAPHLESPTRSPQPSPGQQQSTSPSQLLVDATHLLVSGGRIAILKNSLPIVKF
uniref:Secreted protein n=1 Tax=Ixodes ricinus TaxID=34613 RepID=A0A0K8RDU6_IXORI